MLNTSYKKQIAFMGSTKDLLKAQLYLLKRGYLTYYKTRDVIPMENNDYLLVDNQEGFFTKRENLNFAPKDFPFAPAGAIEYEMAPWLLGNIGDIHQNVYIYCLRHTSLARGLINQIYTDGFHGDITIQAVFPKKIILTTLDKKGIQKYTTTQDITTFGQRSVSTVTGRTQTEIQFIVRDNRWFTTNEKLFQNVCK